MFYFCSFGKGPRLAQAGKISARIPRDKTREIRPEPSTPSFVHTFEITRFCSWLRFTRGRNARALLHAAKPVPYNLCRWRVPIAGPSVAKRLGLRAGRCVVCLVEDMTVCRFGAPYAHQLELTCTDRKVRGGALYVDCHVRRHADRRKGARCRALEGGSYG